MRKYFVPILVLLVIVAPGIVHSAGEGELQVGEDSSVPDCESKMQKYLIFRVGQGDFDEHREILKKDYLDKCEELSEGGGVKVSALETESGESEASRPLKPVKINKDEIDKKLRKNGFLVDGDHTVVAFATERIEKDLINSFFSSISDGEVAKNECETALYDIFSKKGFSCDVGKFNKTQRMKARAFRTVVNRYKDLSYMPNDSTIKAASIVDRSARAVVTCGVQVDIDDSGVGFEACAKGRCKAVDAASKGRIATATDSKCESNENKTTAYIGAIRDVCNSMGRSIGSDMVGVYSKK
ncbi:MAG: hypothetical protein HN337_06705 [Deltaproteobacteria bacterium]|nr:hypothetical protein [Deltaproteobacteria bacterium]